MNPVAVNRHGDTPFHCAARCQNQSSMAAMLQIFPSVCAVADQFSELVVSELLAICARRANARAVADLVRRGADLENSDVLHVIVRESTLDPSNFRPLLNVYRTIVDQSLLWHCHKTGREVPRPDSAEYRNRKRRTVLYLLTRPSEDRGGSVMDEAIKVGAGKFLRAVLSTPGVLRFDDLAGEIQGQQTKHVTYDVTDMMPFTMTTPSDEFDDIGLRR